MREDLKDKAALLGPINTWPLEEKKEAAKRDYIELRKTVKEICEEFEIKEPTLYSWIQKEGWKEERDRKELLLKQLAKALSFYEDPNTERQALVEGNLEMLLRIQGLALANLQHRLMSGNFVMDLQDTIQKMSAALEKLNATKQKIDSGGVEKSEVLHVHQIDMDQALDLALMANRQGKQLSVGEAATALAEQQKKVRDDAKSK